MVTCFPWWCSSCFHKHTQVSPGETWKSTGTDRCSLQVFPDWWLLCPCNCKGSMKQYLQPIQVSGTCAPSPAARWRVSNWYLSLCTHESRFTPSACDSHERVWRHSGIIQHNWFCSGSVTVWGCVSLQTHGPLHSTRHQYLGEILKPVVRP